MNDFFIALINRSVSVCWLILAVLVIRLLFRKAPKWLNPLLWGLVGLRLVLPFSVQSIWSLIPSADPVQQSIVPSIQNGVHQWNTLINGYIENSTITETAPMDNNIGSILTVFVLIWAIGVLALLLYSAVSYIQLHRRIQTAVRLRENIWQSEKVDSPFVLGMIHPRIYMPFKISNNDAAFIIAHEQAHIQRRDHWWKPIGFLILTVYWFNPLLWIAYKMFCEDIELACDEKAVSGYDRMQRADYSQVLLTCSIAHRGIKACPLAFGETGVRERVKQILTYKKPALWIMVLAVICAGATAVFFATDPKHEVFDFKENQITKVVVQTMQSEAQQQSFELNPSEMDELESRLTSLNRRFKLKEINPNMETTGAQKWLWEINLESGQKIFVSGDYNNLAYIQMEEKCYQTSDKEFLKYCDNLYTRQNQTLAVVEEPVSQNGLLTPETAEQCIAEILKTLIVHKDGMVNFTIPSEIPQSDKNIRFTITLLAEYRTDSGGIRTERPLDHKDGWQLGETYTYQLNLQEDELIRVIFGAVFEEVLSEDSWKEYALDYVELTEPIQYDVPAVIAKETVNVEQTQQNVNLYMTFKDGTQTKVAFKLPETIQLIQDAETNDLIFVQGEKKVGSLVHADLAASIEELKQVDPAQNTLPMQVFAGIALSNHVQYENYTVQSYSESGAAATAQYLWQNMGKVEEGMAAAELPFNEENSALMYDWEKMPIFLQMTFNKEVVSEKGCTEIAKSMTIE